MICKGDLSPQAQELILWLETQGYICPWGEWWDGLFKILPVDNGQGGKEKKAPTPLILTGWYISGNLEKWVQLCEQIRWADQHGAINEAEKYIRALPPDCWHKWQGSKYP